jgi:glycosyltransferase involved in cell wall biosynthesis
MRVHQITATLAYGDAITNHILEIDRRLKAWGLDSRIYAENIESRISWMGRPDREYAPFLEHQGDLLIYHYSVYTPNLDLYKRSRNRKIVIYHNITPPEFFRGYDSGLETVCRLGRLALSDLADCDLALADSDFNRRELVAAGVLSERTDVLPIFFSLDRFEHASLNSSLFKRLKKNGTTNLLYVGRLVPNKRCEDLVKLLYSYRKHVNPKAHLWLVGYRFLTVYQQFLESLIARLELEDAVTFTDRVSLGDLRTYYEACDVFVYASRHEGFGVPLLESMYFDLPVLAHNSTTVPETLGPAGVLFSRLAYAEIAEALDLLVVDAELRQHIIRRQRQRLAEFAPERVEAKLYQVLTRVGALDG